MSACETCWRAASFRAHVMGGTTAQRYREILAEQEQHPTCPEWKREAEPEKG